MKNKFAFAVIVFGSIEILAGVLLAIGLMGIALHSDDESLFGVRTLLAWVRFTTKVAYITAPIGMFLLSSLAIWRVLPEDTSNKHTIDKRLIKACKKAPLQTVRDLIAAGADVNAKDTAGETPLMYASKAGAVRAVKLLLEAGAEVNATNKSGRTALMYAGLSKDAETTKLLLTAGANVGATDEDGGTALMRASRSGNVEAVKLLLAAGAEVNYAENINAASGVPDYRTALGWACWEKETEVVKLLLDAGAKVGPEEERLAGSSSEIVKLLQEAKQ